MKLPRLNELPVSRGTVDTFLGYDRNLRIGDGAFHDMKNLSADHYPALSPRACRKLSGKSLMRTDHQRGGMANLDGLCYVDEGFLHYMHDGTEHSVDLGLSIEDGKPKQLVTFGSYLIVLPDKKYVNTADPSDLGSIDASMTVLGAETPFYDPTEKTVFTVKKFGSTEPSSPEDGEYWVDMSSDPAVLKRYSAQSGIWRAMKAHYKLPAEGIGRVFGVGDCVSIRSITTEVFFESAEVTEKGENYLIICAPPIRWEHASYVISRQMPVMDFCFEHENRLWGCRYGLAANGQFVNEIYASKLGDFKNWNSFQGVSTDSYVASCGTDGKWTGAICALGYPLFWKEGYLHKVYGSYPANYQIQVTPCRGVMAGCAKSLAVVNEALYYKAREGVMRYDGSLPADISHALGGVFYSDAVACGYRNKYYISMKDREKAWHLFVFDARRGLWHREDSLHVEEFCPTADALYYLEAGLPLLRMIDGDGQALEEQVDWMAETGVLGLGSPDRKYISRINVRMSMQTGTRVRFFAEYDSSGKWESLAAVTGRRLGGVTVPLRPRRCDHIRLRIEGTGDAKIYALTLCSEQGSDVR